MMTSFYPNIQKIFFYQICLKDVFSRAFESLARFNWDLLLSWTEDYLLRLQKSVYEERWGKIFFAYLSCFPWLFCLKSYSFSVYERRKIVVGSQRFCEKIRKLRLYIFSELGGSRLSELLQVCGKILLKYITSLFELLQCTIYMLIKFKLWITNSHIQGKTISNQFCIIY